MNNRRGLFLAVLGVAFIVLSKSSLFDFIANYGRRHRHPALDEGEGFIFLITFLLMALGITFMLVGTYEYMKAGEGEQ